MQLDCIFWLYCIRQAIGKTQERISYFSCTSPLPFYKIIGIIIVAGGGGYLWGCLGDRSQIRRTRPFPLKSRLLGAAISECGLVPRSVQGTR